MQVMLNGTAHQFEPPPETVAELVRALNLEGKRIAVEMNGEIVPKSRHAQTRVTAGDHLEIVAAVGGG
jgi:sulfur carrier protein